MFDRMQNLAQDLRVAVRQLMRSKTFSLTVVLTLAVGIGLNAAIFTMVDCVMLRPLGYRDAERIYGLNTHFLDANRSIPRMGGGDYADVAQQASSVEYAAYYQGPYSDGAQTAGRTFYLASTGASPEFMRLMGVEPLAGRIFATTGHNKDKVKDPSEAMVSSVFARESFGSVAAALGKTISFEGKTYNIVGVMPDGFTFPGKTQLWIELPSEPEYAGRTSYSQMAVVKLKPGVSAEQLNAELATISQRLQKAYPKDDGHKTIEAVSLQEQLIGKIKPVLRLLMGAVGVVLLIVCANITHLQLIRGTQLRREVTIRAALGATRSALARRAGLEVLVLALTGCVAGILIAEPAMKLLVRMAPPDLPRLADVHLNVDVILYSFLASLVTMAATALLPLWRSWRIDAASAMKQDASRGTESRGSGYLRQVLVAGEVALTLTLSVAAVLLVRQLIAESETDLGFAAEKLVVLDTHGTSHVRPLLVEQFNGKKTEAELRAPIERARAQDMQALNNMLDGVRAVPGVERADAIFAAPLRSAGSNGSYAVRGVSRFEPGADLPNANFESMTPGYLETMHIPLLRGRNLTDADGPGSQKVLLISKTMADESFRGVDPVGKQIMCGWDSQDEWWTIVGVVGDVRQDSPGSAPPSVIYTPVAQHAHTAAEMQLVVRTHTNAGAMAGTLERLMKTRFPEVAVNATTMQADLGETERAQRFRTLLFSSFAGVSILLAITGMYGVTAYTVTQKRFEFALRFALGAQRGTVLGSVLRNALTVAAIGIVSGVGLSLTLKQVLGAVLGKMAGVDAPAFVIAGAGVFVVALLAALQPAFRAAMVEPMQVLRSE